MLFKQTKYTKRNLLQKNCLTPIKKLFNLCIVIEIFFFSFLTISNGEFLSEKIFNKLYSKIY